MKKIWSQIIYTIRHSSCGPPIATDNELLFDLVCCLMWSWILLYHIVACNTTWESKCPQGICYDNLQYCNGVPDCPDGSDESPQCGMYSHLQDHEMYFELIIYVIYQSCIYNDYIIAKLLKENFWNLLTCKSSEYWLCYLALSIFPWLCCICDY